METITRQQILQAAYQEIYERGVQAASVDRIAEACGLTPRELLTRFPSKMALSQATVAEVLKPMVLQTWVAPLDGAPDPMRAIESSFENAIHYMASLPVNRGCVLNNLGCEMSSLDAGFQQQIQELFMLWEGAFERALRQAPLKPDVEAAATARFLVAQIEGVFALSKTTQDPDTLWSGFRSFQAYLKGLVA